MKVRMKTRIKVRMTTRITVRMKTVKVGMVRPIQAKVSERR
jgi:hypothetical protein